MSGTSQPVAPAGPRADVEDRQQRQVDAEQLQPPALETDPLVRRVVDHPGGGDRPARPLAGSRVGLVTGQGE